MMGSRGRRAVLVVGGGVVVPVVVGDGATAVAAVASATATVAAVIGTVIARIEDSGRAKPGSDSDRTLRSGWHIIRRGAMPDCSALAAGAGWRLMRLAARLMPRAAGHRWLAEADSFLAEAPPSMLRGTIRSYLASAPQLIAVSWAGEAARRVRVTGDRPR
jgi:hypothetical protein